MLAGLQRLVVQQCIGRAGLELQRVRIFIELLAPVADLVVALCNELGLDPQLLEQRLRLDHLCHGQRLRGKLAGDTRAQGQQINPDAGLVQRHERLVHGPQLLLELGFELVNQRRTVESRIGAQGLTGHWTRLADTLKDVLGLRVQCFAQHRPGLSSRLKLRNGLRQQRGFARLGRFQHRHQLSQSVVGSRLVEVVDGGGGGFEVALEQLGDGRPATQRRLVRLGQQNQLPLGGRDRIVRRSGIARSALVSRIHRHVRQRRHRQRWHLLLSHRLRLDLLLGCLPLQPWPHAHVGQQPQLFWLEDAGCAPWLELAWADVAGVIHGVPNL